MHSSARDARRVDPSRFEEVPIGRGDIDWMQYLGTLGALDYRGWVVIDRQGGADRMAEVAAAVGFLRRFVR